MHSKPFSLPPRHDALPLLHAWLSVRCAELAVDDTRAHRLEILLEELFINSLDHGLASGVIDVDLEYSNNVLQLHYEDSAPPFDPTQTDDAPADDDQRIGGLGLRLIRGMAQSVAYQRVGERNRLTIEL